LWGGQKTAIAIQKGSLDCRGMRVDVGIGRSREVPEKLKNSLSALKIVNEKDHFQNLCMFP
jgi:hypothetical protein